MTLSFAWKLLPQKLLGNKHITTPKKKRSYAVRTATSKDMILVLQVHAETLEKYMRKIGTKQEKKEEINVKHLVHFLVFVKNGCRCKNDATTTNKSESENKPPRVNESNGDNSLPENND